MAIYVLMVVAEQNSYYKIYHQRMKRLAKMIENEQARL
jgi:hypothetical protein